MARLNIAQVEELKDIMDEAFDDLISTYIQDSEDKLKQLDRAHSDQDSQTVASLGHSLKGSSLNICAEDLSGIFKQIEDAGRAENLSSVHALLVQANTEFNELKIALNAL